MILLYSFETVSCPRKPWLRGVGDWWCSVHVEFFFISTQRRRLSQLRFQLTSLASWSCRRTTHQHQSTWLYCRWQTTWPSHVYSTIWLRVGEAEQEERVHVCWTCTPNSPTRLTIKQPSDCSDCIQRAKPRIPSKTRRYVNWLKQRPADICSRTLLLTIGGLKST